MERRDWQEWGSSWGGDCTVDQWDRYPCLLLQILEFDVEVLLVGKLLRKLSHEGLKACLEFR